MSDPGSLTGPAETGSPSAIIVAGGEETRVLLRGLLRLQHVAVLAEAAGSTDGLVLLQRHRPSLVLIETSLVEGSPAALVRAAVTLLPESRFVVIGPLDPGGGSIPDGPTVRLLRKPFRIAEFAHAIGRGPEPVSPN